MPEMFTTEIVTTEMLKNEYKSFDKTVILIYNVLCVTTKYFVVYRNFIFTKEKQ